MRPVFPRTLSNRSLNLAKPCQLLWATDGINQPEAKTIALLGRAVPLLNLHPVMGGGSSSPFQTGNACPWGRVEGAAVVRTARDFLYGLETIYIIN